MLSAIWRPELEDHPAVLPEENARARSTVGGLAGRRLPPAGMSRSSAAAVHPVMEVEQAEPRFGRLEQDGARPVAEQHRGGTVERIDDGVHQVRADHDHPPVGARGHSCAPVVSP